MGTLEGITLILRVVGPEPDMTHPAEMGRPVKDAARRMKCDHSTAIPKDPVAA